jgi:protoporphyrinogen oxidase
LRDKPNGFTFVHSKTIFEMVIIIGAGVAGLTCATYLQEKNIPFTILESSNSIGGRVQTDQVEGFLLDRGFQILLTAYPEAQRLLNYDALNLKKFQSGAMIRMEDDSVSTMANPFKEPSTLFSTLFSKVGTLADKMRILRLVFEVEDLKDDEIFQRKGVSTLEYLENFGFSEQMIHYFFKPFFGGVFLENQLVTSSNFFEFVFKQFYKGDAAIPALGIQEIPKQIAVGLPHNSIRFNTKVIKIQDKTVWLESGEKLLAEKIVLATDAYQADKLLGKTPDRKFNTTTCTYFSAESSPLKRQMLMLNANRNSVVHNLCVPSDIAPDYAPKGKSLISVSTQGLDLFDEQNLAKKIKIELRKWFGNEVENWQYLKSYHIPQALPTYKQASMISPIKITENLYQCGDQTAYPSLNATMLTGRLVAEELAK